jgi:23S rRNA pseudouridine2605 synthase
VYKDVDGLDKPGHDEKKNMPTEKIRSGKPGKAPFGGKPPFRSKKLKTSLPRPAVPDAPLPARKSAERVAKVIARAGLCSRRDAEAWIAEGRVSVNGAVITSPALNVRLSDSIVVDGKPLPQRERTRLFLYYKPRGLVTTNSDPEGRPTIFGALPKNLPRLISVGRLDLNTEGLLLLTNDGRLARVLELPETGWLRRYRVRAHGRIQQSALDALRKGVEIDGIRYGAIEATVDREQGANVWLTFAIREGKNREVRNVLEHLGLQVNRLIRVSYGPFQLAEMREGAVEEVRTRMLRDQLGERITALAGADFAGPISDRNADDGESPSPLRRGAIPSPHRNLGLPEFRAKSRASDKPDIRRGDKPTQAAQARLGRNDPGEGQRSQYGKPRDRFEGKKRREEPETKPESKRITRNDTIADRRGRSIPVTRTSTEKPERPQPQKARGGKARRPDRSGGPRPSRPR